MTAGTLDPSNLALDQSADRTTWVLRAEGAAMAALATSAYASTGASWWLYLALLLVPDIAMLGYLRGPKFGALIYNGGHTYALPFASAAVGTVSAEPLLTSIAFVWIAHIGFDRMLGFGLKRSTGFKHTHLGNL
ncbi:DUF4260 domain-containing protein [Rhizobiaceae bacterium]|nr:DUF4260 domain-containing protein [Rhizobiaceae bacterium]